MATQALSGIRVISLGSAWAGPYVGRVLSELGAEVFRVELHTASGFARGNPEMIEAWKKKLLSKGMTREDVEKAAKLTPGDRGNFQVNNLGIGLDLRSERGKDIFSKLAALSDIVIDGFSQRVMSSLGLGYDTLREIKPDIIYCSIPALGMTGPEKDVRMWGTGCEFVGGLTSTRGYPGGRPHRAANFIADGIAAPHILTAILAALAYRTETGKGQHVDVAQAECATSILGEAIMDFSLNGRIAQPTGNQHRSYAPHNCYRCAGEDTWLTIAVTSEEEWQNLCRVMGNPELTANPRFRDMARRRAHQKELDPVIEEWSSHQEHYTLQRLLQEAGVPAAAVVTMEEHVLHDPQVRERGLYTWLPYQDGVLDPIARVPWLLSEMPTSLFRCAPYVGQDNEYLLREVLGLPEAEIETLAAENVVGMKPPEPL